MMRKCGPLAVCLVGAMGGLALSACDVPTELPHWDTTWALPIEALELSAESLLPSDITITPDRQAFELLTTGANLEERLGDICPECRILDGQLAPKPAFEAVLGSALSLPADLASARIVGGQARIEFFHDFGFDPIQPSANEFGSIEVVLLSAGDTLAAGSVSGETESFPSGTQRVMVLPFRNVVLRDSIAVHVTITSPAGGLVMVDGSRGLELSVLPSPIQVSEAEVRVEDHAIELDDTAIEVVGGEGLVNRIQSGVLLLEVDNPFQVTGSLQIALSAPGAPAIVRHLSLGTGQTESRAEFTGHELRAILEDEKATLSATGTVTATGGTVTIRPDQVLKANSRFDLTVATREN